MLELLKIVTSRLIERASIIMMMIRIASFWEPLVDVLISQ